MELAKQLRAHGEADRQHTGPLLPESAQRRAAIRRLHDRVIAVLPANVVNRLEVRDLMLLTTFVTSPMAEIRAEGETKPEELAPYWEKLARADWPTPTRSVAEPRVLSDTQQRAKDFVRLGQHLDDAPELFKTHHGLTDEMQALQHSAGELVMDAFRAGYLQGVATLVANRHWIDQEPHEISADMTDARRAMFVWQFAVSYVSQVFPAKVRRAHWIGVYPDFRNGQHVTLYQGSMTGPDNEPPESFPVDEQEWWAIIAANARHAADAARWLAVMIQPVVIGERGEPILVLGKTKPALPDKAYDVVRAIIECPGIQKDKLEAVSPAARRILKNLVDSDADWAVVDPCPGSNGPRRGYRFSVRAPHTRARHQQPDAKPAAKRSTTRTTPPKPAARTTRRRAGRARRERA